MEHWIEWHPAYDKRDPDPNKNYGIHGVEMRWYVCGEEGVVQFVVYTNWYLPHVAAELLTPGHKTFRCAPMPADLGYHSPIPHYDSQNPMRDCLLLGGDCYYDGSTMNAERVFSLLVEQGGDAVWDELDRYYRGVFRCDIDGGTQE